MQSLAPVLARRARRLVAEAESLPLPDVAGRIRATVD
jgi:hypothetical protein